MSCCCTRRDGKKPDTTCLDCIMGKHRNCDDRLLDEALHDPKRRERALNALIRSAIMREQGRI